MPEEEIAGASYLLAFLNDLETLTNQFAYFKNQIRKFRARGEIEKLEESERQTLEQYVDAINFWVVRTYVKFEALKEHLKEFKKENKELKENYAKISANAVPEVEIVEKYVIALHKCFVAGVMPTLLEKAQEIYGALIGVKNE